MANCTWKLSFSYANSACLLLLTRLETSLTPLITAQSKPSDFLSFSWSWIMLVSEQVTITTELPITNFLDHHYSCKQIEDKMFTIASWHNCKNTPFFWKTIPSFFLFMFLIKQIICFDRKFSKIFQINPTIGTLDAKSCLCLIIAADFSHTDRTCHFSPIRRLC